MRPRCTYCGGPYASYMITGGCAVGTCVFGGAVYGETRLSLLRWRVAAGVFSEGAACCAVFSV